MDDIDPASVVTIGDPSVTSNGGRVSSWCKVECRLKDGGSRFGYYRTIRWSKRFYARIYVGWKLMDIAGANASNWHEYTDGEDKRCLKPFGRFIRLRESKTPDKEFQTLTKFKRR